MPDRAAGDQRWTVVGTGVAGVTRVDTYDDRLRAAAFEAVRRGWPVAPGVDGIDAEGFAEVRPVVRNGDMALVRDPDQAWRVWEQRPYGVLLACGRGVDALEVPFRVMELLPALASAGLAVPVATAAAPSRWVLVVATGSGTLRDDLAAASVCLRGIGQWVALPPTTPAGQPPLRWTTLPAEDPDTALPSADEVQLVLAEALRSGTSEC
ncbi:MAG: bifunctional DNA primase/polymerase [Pseudonocardiaceae bacterium]